MRRGVLLAVIAALALGCSGVGQSLMDLSDTEIAMGADAKVPAGFPLPSPAGGTLFSSVKFDLGPVQSSIVVYELPAGTTEVVLAPYEDAMKAAGFAVTRTSQPNNHTVTGTGPDNIVWSAALMEDQGKAMLTLMVGAAP